MIISDIFANTFKQKQSSIKPEIVMHLNTALLNIYQLLSGKQTGAVICVAISVMGQNERKGPNTFLLPSTVRALIFILLSCDMQMIIMIKGSFRYFSFKISKTNKKRSLLTSIFCVATYSKTFFKK